MEDKKEKKYLEYYEDILQEEKNDFKYKKHHVGLNEYVAEIKYLGVIYKYKIKQEEEESYIYDEDGRIMKTKIRREGEGKEKWEVISEWDEVKRLRDNRNYAENIALSKLFNFVVKEAYKIQLTYEEEIWEEGEKKWRKEMRKGDYLEIEERGNGNYYSSFSVNNKKMEMEEKENMEEARAGLLKKYMVEKIKRLKIFFNEKKEHDNWKGK